MRKTVGIGTKVGRHATAVQPGQAKQVYVGAKLALALPKDGDDDSVPRLLMHARSQTVLMPRNSRRILIAEDHFDSRDALRALFEAFGFEVIEAINGQQAVEIAHRTRPGLILMDVMMPVMDGFEAMRKIKQSPETNDIPIIAVTAMDGARELALHAGADDYVRKPVDIRQLIGLVNGWLAPNAT